MRITSFHINGKSNYIPNNVKSCAELLLTNTNNNNDDLFGKFLYRKDNINHTYNSKIPYVMSELNIDILKRRDMFNVFLLDRLIKLLNY